MQNLLDVLLKTLKNDERLLVDGKLAKNKIVELALAMDEGLITLLIKNKTINPTIYKSPPMNSQQDFAYRRTNLIKLITIRSGVMIAAGS